MANEKRLIDANALLYEYCQANGCNEVIDEVCPNCFTASLIADAPTVDAVEVVHGRWEDQYDGKYANPRYRCSVCKEKALYKFERDCLGNHKDVQALTPICPYCSAKLDGGKANDI